MLLIVNSQALFDLIETIMEMKKIFDQKKIVVLNQADPIHVHRMEHMEILKDKEEVILNFDHFYKGF